MAKSSSTTRKAGRELNESPGPRVVAVPRAWLILLTVLGVAPWIVFAALQLGREAPGVAELARSSTVNDLPAGPWGHLEMTPITISPPMEYVPSTWGEVLPSAWTFPGTSAEQAEAFLVGAGMSAADARRVRATARPTPEVDGVSLLPDDATVRGLAPGTRAAIYRALGQAGVNVDRTRTPINFDQVTAYRYHGDSIDEWLGTDMLSAATRALVDPLIYRDKGFLFFADIERVRSLIGDPAEVQRLAKRLMRQETVLVRIGVDAPANIDALAEYWGRGGRRTDIRPILESLSRASALFDDPNGAVDISHLLPTLARQLLYRYPRVTPQDLQRPLLANCLWTALNFFNAEADSRYLDVRFALDHLRADYFLVQDGFQLGDIVAFRDPSGNLVHVAVYLADDLVFSKNGTSPLAPWSILPIEQLAGHYAEYSDGWLVSYHRRNDL